MDSYGTNLKVEYATNVAIVVTTRLALDLLATYHGLLIKTGKDKRKAMFRDVRAGFQEVFDACLGRLESDEFLIKQLTSANRIMQEVLSDL